jgi:hypothetical protein
VGVSFQPRKEVALKPSLFNRGWKAAPTGTPPILKTEGTKKENRIVYVVVFFLDI